jgi:hypothetical protein
LQAITDPFLSRRYDQGLREKSGNGAAVVLIAFGVKERLLVGTTITVHFTHESTVQMGIVGTLQFTTLVFLFTGNGASYRLARVEIGVAIEK